MKIKKILLFASFALLTGVSAWADVVWPALYLENRLVSWWAISLGLIIEYLFVRQLFGFSVKKAILADIVMNLASTIPGILLIPIAGIVWEFFPGIILYKVFRIGTFNPGTWAATFIFASAINAALESLVIRWAFRTRVGKRGFWGLFVANAISVGVALASVFFYFPRL